MVAMRDLHRELYTDKPPRGDLRAAEVARTYRAHCGKETRQSNYFLYLEEDVTEAVANARRLGVGLGAMCADVPRSLNASLKRAYNDHPGRGGGGCARGNPTRTGGGGGFKSVGVVEERLAAVAPAQAPTSLPALPPPIESRPLPERPSEESSDDPLDRRKKQEKEKKKKKREKRERREGERNQGLGGGGFKPAWGGGVQDEGEGEPLVHARRPNLVLAWNALARTF